MRNFIANRTARYADIPENLESDRCHEKIDAILNDPAGYKVTDEYNHKDVRQTLKRHFGIKCIYCESSPIASSTFRIDHYRPKKNIKEVPTHTGYYWLAYEWSNLMQSCQLCNGAKSNFFPLKATSVRITHDMPSVLDAAFRKPDTNPLNTEERLLLNPELDSVESHFSFNPDGKIASVTEEGIKSIEHYDLQRGDLIFWRKTINDKLLKRTKEAIEDFEIDAAKDLNNAKLQLFRFLRNEFRTLLLDYKNNEQYSLYSFNVFENYQSFVIDFIHIQEHKDLLLEAYNLYKNNKLT
jgi:uncharacterized protein (TIGR02646 family)